MPSIRRLAMAATITTVAAGLLTSSGASAGPVDTQLAYTCGFPSGEQPVTVRVMAFLPDEATVGDFIIPVGVSVTVTLPPAAVADLTALGATTASANTDLSVAVDDSGLPADTVWSVLAPPTPIPTDGELTLEATGDVSAVIPSFPGIMIFTAAGLNLQLSLQREDGSSTDPPFVTASCTLSPGQDGFLALIFVQEGQHEPPPGTPENCGDIPPMEPGLPTGCSFVRGASNVAKLKSAMQIDTGLMNIALANFVIGERNLLFQSNIADLPDGGLPPSTATFLTFGFMPIKATMELTQVGPIPVEQVAQGGPPFLYWLKSTATMSVRVRDVTVNGVPLDVGENCRSAVPMEIELVGGTPDYTNILLGGPLQGFATIPPFSGCGVGEDLDPLLTGSVSGPGNYVKMHQGSLCAPADPWFCPPTTPEPVN